MSKELEVYIKHVPYTVPHDSGPWVKGRWRGQKAAAMCGNLLCRNPHEYYNQSLYGNYCRYHTLLQRIFSSSHLDMLDSHVEEIDDNLMFSRVGSDSTLDKRGPESCGRNSNSKYFRYAHRQYKEIREYLYTFSSSVL